MSKAVKKSLSPLPRNKKRKKAVVVARDPALLHSLGIELFQLTYDFLGEIGLSEKERREMLESAHRKGSRIKPSRELLSTYSALSNMLNVWRKSKKYTAPDGTPRVIPIFGKGATLECLARKYFPKVPIEEVVRIICAQGEVQQHKDDKVALVGGIVVLHERTKEQALSSFNTRVRALASNCLHNLDQPPKQGTGYFDRQVTGSLSGKAFRHYAQELRPQLQNLLDHVESGMNTSSTDRAKKGDSCGLALFLFREDGPLF